MGSFLMPLLQALGRGAGKVGDWMQTPMGRQLMAQTGMAIGGPDNIAAQGLGQMALGDVAAKQNAAALSANQAMQDARLERILAALGSRGGGVAGGTNVVGATPRISSDMLARAAEMWNLPALDQSVAPLANPFDHPILAARRR